MARQAQIFRLFKQRIRTRRIHPQSGQAHQYEIGAQHAVQHCGGAQDRYAVKEHAFCFVDPALLVANVREEAEGESGGDGVRSHVFFRQCYCVEK